MERELTVFPTSVSAFRQKYATVKNSAPLRSNEPEAVFGAA